jgi:AcrR family transcriptional regulator
MPRYSKAEIIDALREAEGFVKYAADRLGASRTTFYNWFEKDDDVKAVRDQLIEDRKDEAERYLLDLIRNRGHKDHFRALEYFLSTMARDRGYGPDPDDGAGTFDLSNVDIRIHRTERERRSYRNSDSDDTNE